MKNETAVDLLSALAQRSRLAVFRMLVEHGPEGIAAGQIADQLDLAPAALSFHLKELSHKGLVQSRPDGRYVIYSANFKTMNALIAYLTENCCVGSSCELEASACQSATSQKRTKR